MEPSELEIIVKALKNAIVESDKQFNEETASHAQIIGFLQGTIKGVINHIEENGKI